MRLHWRVQVQKKARKSFLPQISIKLDFTRFCFYFLSMTLNQIFSVLSAACSLYMLLCFIRVMLTWFPGAQYSGFGRFLSSLCDPFLNLFRGLRFLRFSAFDFSPAIALCVLIALSNIFASFARGSRITLGSVLAMLLSMAWSIVSSLLGFLIVLLLIRLIVIFMQKGYASYGSIWDQVDRALSPFVFRITSIFTRGATPPYKNALIVSILLLAVIWFAGRYAISLLAVLLSTLPV